MTGATVAQWREHFLTGGQAALKSRPADERDDELQRLRAKVGEITMTNELLLERCHRLEANLPLALGRELMGLALRLLVRLVTANRRRDRVPELEEASGAVDALRITLRLSKRLSGSAATSATWTTS